MRTAREKARKLRQAEHDGGVEDGQAPVEPGTKRKLEDVVSPAEEISAPTAATTEVEDEKAQSAGESLWSEPASQLQTAVLTKPSLEMRGHTSYLTFATLYPASVRAAVDAQEDLVAPTPTRVAQLAAVESNRAGSQETDYGNDGMEQIMGSLTEEQLIALAGN